MNTEIAVMTYLVVIKIPINFYAEVMNFFSLSPFTFNPFYLEVD